MIPFFPYPQVFLQDEEELVGIFRDVGRRGAFIEQEHLLPLKRTSPDTCSRSI